MKKLLNRETLVFTFHYVSIKSPLPNSQGAIILYLHSTMYLLNRIHMVTAYRNKVLFTFHYVSIKSHNRSYMNHNPYIYIPLCIY